MRSFPALLVLLALAAPAAAEPDRSPYTEADVVRTNDSRWLANIRRGSSVALRQGETEGAVTTEEVSEPALTGAEKTP